MNKKEAQSKNYVDQTPRFRCEVCSFSFCMERFEDESSYYCCEGSPSRPLCGSAVLGEQFWNIKNNSKYVIAIRKWSVWARRTKVNKNGICDHFTPLDTR